MCRCPPESDAEFFLDSCSLNGPVPGSKYSGAGTQFATGDPALAETAMSGTIWTRCLVPPVLGDSSGSAELVMVSLEIKEDMAHRIQAAELRQGPWGATPPYMDAFAVLHGTAAEQVSKLCMFCTHISVIYVMRVLRDKVNAVC